MTNGEGGNSASSHGNKMKGIKKGKGKGIAGCPRRQFEDRRHSLNRRIEREQGHRLNLEAWALPRAPRKKILKS